jgi:hypothetical protein
VREIICGVYALLDPETLRVMYVGQSIDVDYRYRQHCAVLNSDPNQAKVRWVAGLARRGLQPTLELLVECERHELSRVEYRLIREHKARGEAELNVVVGESCGGLPPRSAASHPDDWHQVNARIEHIDRQLIALAAELAPIAGAAMADRVLRLRRRFGSGIQRACADIERDLFAGANRS